ncbi:MAG: SDR family NAD(P)-dependent oxidoreductase [Clostridiales bacterium]|nr:SDR family NAD(P)-dependent oxidoreductase [Clostridiales bacterium]
MASKLVWMSGASSGLGKAACDALSQTGWTVVAGARSFAKREGRQGSVHYLALDVQDADSVRDFCARAFELYGPPQALINAAGILIFGPAEETSLSEYEAVMDTVLMGTIRFTQAALPYLRQQPGGKIVMVSSVNGLMPTPFQSAYVAAKHALEGYSECLMLETAAQGIQVMLVEPGDHAGGSGKYRTSAQTVSPLYEAAFTRAREVILKDEAQGGSPLAFGRKLARVMDRRRLPARLRVTTLKETAAIVLHDVLPGRLFQKFLRDYYKV